jgi:hypothetical protein
VSAGHYVTMRRGGRPPRVAWLAGPYPDHESALRAVDSARRLACHLDPWAWFDAFGTTSLDPPVRTGILNHLVRNDRAVTSR